MNITAYKVEGSKEPIIEICIIFETMRGDKVVVYAHIHDESLESRIAIIDSGIEFKISEGEMILDINQYPKILELLSIIKKDCWERIKTVSIDEFDELICDVEVAQKWRDILARRNKEFFHKNSPDFWLDKVLA